MSNMNSPLFQVGELVGLVSLYEPESNGKYFVTDVEFGVFLNAMTSEIVKCNRYRLSDVGGYWMESALRKLHKPSEYSYDQLLTELKNSSKIPSTV